MTGKKPGLGKMGERETYHEVFRKLLQEVSTILKENYSLDISESFVIMMVKLIALDPSKKFIMKQPVIRKEMERLRRIVIEYITGMTAIQRNTIRMQFLYRSSHFPRDELVVAHKKELEMQVKGFIQDLRESVPKKLKQIELYYRKLIAVIIILNDMGTPSNINVVKETEAALSSVFPMDEVGLLSSITAREREHEIRQLVNMTAGIRLYNRELDPAGHGTGIDDVTGMLPDKIFRCANMLSDMREVNIQRLIRYTTLIKPYFMSDSKMSSTKMGRLEISQDMLWVRQGLVMVHQVLVYIKELSDELTTEDERCEICSQKIRSTMDELRSTVQDNNNASLPTFLVYPKFIVLSDAWKILQGSLTFLETLIDLIGSVSEYSENDLKDIDAIVENMSKTLRIPDESQFFDFPSENISDDDMTLAYKTEFTAQMDPLAMMYSGFCVWSLVNGLGLVLLSNPNLGVFNWREGQFLLATAKAADEFRRNPDTFLFKAIFVARRWPELISLLKLENQVFNPDVQADDDRPQTAMNAKVSMDSGVQTEVHPLESNIVQGYTWNEWEYRRKAILLSKLSKCETHSTQTYIQSVKSNSESQTYNTKNSKIQTMHDKYAEVPMSQFYMWGLRGCHQHPPHVVEMIRDSALCFRCLVPSTKKPKKKCK